MKKYYAVNLVRSSDSVSADIFEVLPECLETFREAEECSSSADMKFFAKVKLFDNYEEARNFYDKYTSEMYKF